MKQHTVFSFLFLFITALWSAQNLNLINSSKKDSVAVNNVQEIVLNSKEKFQTGAFHHSAPSDIRINASMLNRNDRNFNPFYPRNFELNNDVHYLPPNTNLPPVGLQKLGKIKIYQSK